MERNEQNEASENQKEKNTTDKEGVWTPKVVFDGKCDHFYVDQELDPEGNMFAQCKKCPMGRLYNPKSYIIVEGKLNERK